MTEQINLRLDKKIINELEEIAKAENLERPAFLRKIIIEGLRQERIKHALQQYIMQEISLERASEICKVSVREMIDILHKYGLGSNMNKEDYLELIKGVEL